MKGEERLGREKGEKRKGREEKEGRKTCRKEGEVLGEEMRDLWERGKEDVEIYGEKREEEIGRYEKKRRAGKIREKGEKEEGVKEKVVDENGMRDEERKK